MQEPSSEEVRKTFLKDFLTVLKWGSIIAVFVVIFVDLQMSFLPFNPIVYSHETLMQTADRTVAILFLCLFAGRFLWMLWARNQAPLGLPIAIVLGTGLLLYLGRFSVLPRGEEATAVTTVAFVSFWGTFMVGLADLLTGLIWATIRGKLTFFEKTSWMWRDD